MVSPTGHTPQTPGELVNGWAVTWSRGSAGDFHHNAPPDDTPPQIWIHRPDRPALVLGSTQPADLVDAAAAETDGIEVCDRRSGGGLVPIDPDRDCWIDVIVPRTSRLWEDDIGRAFRWVGRRWAEVLAEPPLLLDPVIATANRPSPAGRVWCFADLGHGEVSVGGSKVVGLSQRRTRTWTRIQSMVLWSWPGGRLRRYVDPAAMVRRHPDRFPDPAALGPEHVTAGMPPHATAITPDELARRFLADLPHP
ncbi:MAG: hypothetical protein AAGA65_31195 [Actinomycetota bacterium]